MTTMKKLAIGLQSLFLAVLLSGCGTVRGLLTPPPAPLPPPLCTTIPASLTEPVPPPEPCLGAAVGDDYQACLEGLLGTRERPEDGALMACNNKLIRIREELEK